MGLVFLRLQKEDLPLKAMGTRSYLLGNSPPRMYTSNYQMRTFLSTERLLKKQRNGMIS